METQIGRIVTFLAQYAQINFTKNLYLRNIKYKRRKSKFDTFSNLQFPESTYISLVLHSKPSLVD